MRRETIRTVDPARAGERAAPRPQNDNPRSGAAIRGASIFQFSGIAWLDAGNWASDVSKVPLNFPIEIGLWLYSLLRVGLQIMHGNNVLGVVRNGRGKETRERGNLLIDQLQDRCDVLRKTKARKNTVSIMPGVRTHFLYTNHTSGDKWDHAEGRAIHDWCVVAELTNSADNGLYECSAALK